MNILQNLKQINSDFIFLGDDIKNSIIENGIFTRLIYSDHYMILNCMYILIDPTEFSHKVLIETLIELEQTILSKIEINKKTQYKIKDYLKHLNLSSMFEDKLKKCILKISGIWQTDIEYGITFKFLELDS